MADQILFVAFDVAAGYFADRVHRLYGRIGPWIIGATAISCPALLLLPWLAAADAAPWRAPLFLALTGIWAVTSSALRAPGFPVISRHAAKPQVPALAGLALAGMALASGLIWAERSTRPVAEMPPEKTVAPSLQPGLLFPLLAVAVLGYQILFNLNAAPRYLRDAQPEELIWLMPVFWIGFNGSVALAGRITRHNEVARLFIIACSIGALGPATAMVLPGLQAAAAGQLLRGPVNSA